MGVTTLRLPPTKLGLRVDLVGLVTRSTKARFGQVGNQVRKVKDQVGQGQGQELDNIKFPALKSFLVVVVGWWWWSV